MRWTFAVLATLVVLLAATSMPAFSADGGAVSASVTAATPCITLNIPPLAFGTLPFNTTSGDAQSGVLTNPGSYTNCSVQSEKILLRGTDASGPGGAAWTLGSSAACVIDLFQSRISIPALNTPVTKTDNQLQAALGAGATTEIANINLAMPCTGSSGAGVTMSWQYIFTATF